MKYDAIYISCFPVIVSDKLFLGANEDDFILNGFSIRRFADVVKAEVKDDKCLEIAIAEGVVDRICVPDINLSDWYNVLCSLQKMNKNIIVEKESIDDEYFFRYR